MPDTRTSLVGRDRHLRELALLIDGIAAAAGYAVVLNGTAGAGKTRLAEEAAAMASASGLRVSWATCWRNAAAPLSVWHDLIGGGGEPADAAVTGADLEGTRALWVRTVVERGVDSLAAVPTLLVVDDAQWADPLSMHALGALSARLRGRRVGLLCTVRDHEAERDPLIDALTHGCRQVAVPPLTASELASLASDLTGKPMTAAALARLHERSGGNVLFARALLTGAGDVGGISPTATAVFAEQVAALSDPCQRMLHAAGVIGRRFRVDVLAEVLASDPADLFGLIDEAEQAGLVRAGTVGEFEFSHPLIAEAAYHSGGLPRRVRMHRDVAETLERLRRRGLRIAAVEIAHHYSRAAAAGAAVKAAEFATLAGEEDMTQLAYEDAARDFALALQALELCPRDERRRSELLLDLADAHAAAGDRDAARVAYEDAAGIARQHGWSDLLATAALGVGSGPGGFEIPPFDDRQIALLQEASNDAHDTLRARVLARLSVALALDATAVDRRAALSQEAISIAREHGDAAALGEALASWCDVIPGPEAVEERLGASSEILRCATASKSPSLELLGRRLRVVALLESGRLDEFDIEVAAFAATAGRLAQPVYSWYVPLWRATRAVLDGRFDLAARLRAEAEAIGAAARSDNAMMLTNSQHAMLHCELRASGADAITFFERMHDELPEYDIMVRPALAYALASSGDLPAAREIVITIDSSAYTVDAFGSEFLTTALMLAHASWLADIDLHAATLYEAMAPHRHRVAIDGIGGYVAGGVERTLGILATQLGNIEQARDHFGAAVDQHGRMRAPLLVAVTLRDAGACLDDDDLRARGADAFAALGLAPASGARSNRPPLASGATFRRDGDGWMVGWNGSAGHLRHTKGMADVAALLARPNTDIHVLDLVDIGPTVDSGAASDALDATARRRYKARLEDIEAELADADALADQARSERLHAERDALVAELTAAYGLGGRARKSGASSERARSAVTQRIRDAIARVANVDPVLGRHLDRAIQTGTFCAYRPDDHVNWQL